VWLETPEELEPHQPQAAMPEPVTSVSIITPAHCSNAKTRFQSFFMLTIVQPCFFASS
jgi:hypothetical protein